MTKFNLEYHKCAHTPLLTDELIPYEGKALLQEIFTYQQKVSSLNFMAVIIRPDITYTILKLSEFL